MAVLGGTPLVRHALEHLVDDDLELVRVIGSADVAVAGGHAVPRGDHGGAVLRLLHEVDGATVARTLREGDRGVLPDSAEPEDVRRAIALVADGLTVVAGELADVLVEQLVRTSGDGGHPFPALTPREREVLAGLARGETNGQIARRLGRATKTVRNHVSSICTKLQVLDRAQAALVARDAGLG
ncbi:response regulator transcription factor [Conexibacter sp. SYSU D00693]|uniref:helix-turn-helix transcriptional regulator n=1 Tax=Conexibacter sp. SYSU D00693 TaxID=2812560 RepID=UPI00196B90F9|nr:response regulator transcription factor [Conexibacter sp. SYSU D00693]